MSKRPSGFTLVELAVVLAIVGFLIVGGMYTMSAQMEQRGFEETRARLTQARELLIAYSIVNGRLPCPATAATAGDESPAGGGTCTNPYDGFLPARAIGHLQVDADGFALDAWGNRIRYAVSSAVPVNSQTPRICRPVNPTTPPVAPHFTHKSNLQSQGLDCQPSDLIVCRSASGITGTTCGGSPNQIMTQNLVVAIVYATGKNTALGGGAGADEAANLNGDRVFVYHTPAPSGATGGEFDDQFTWITVGELYSKLIAAGVLP